MIVECRAIFIYICAFKCLDQLYNVLKTFRDFCSM